MGRRRSSARAQVRRSTPAEIGFTAADVAAEMLKAIRLPAGATATPIPAAAPAYSGGAGGYGGGYAVPLAPGGWTDPMVPFGPGRPVRPAALDPLEPDTGRPLPRRFEYPVTFNLPGAGDRYIPWDVLRRLADALPIVRKCIEIRKAEIVALEWDFVVDESVFEQVMLEQATGSAAARAKAAAAGDPTALSESRQKDARARLDIEREFRAKNAGAIAALQRWWDKPDRIQDWTFADWTNALLEEWLVLDATSLYPHKTLGGDLHSLEVIDGSTIKPLLDHRGAVPGAPNPAYQQVLYGFPRGEFTASPGADGEYDRDALLYRPRNRRTHSPYGFGPTEQALLDADLYLKRREWMAAEYSAGVVPELLVQVDAPMTPAQLLDYERVFNDILSGNAAERHRAKFLPQGFTPHEMQSLETRYKPDYDLHLIRLIGLAYDVMPTELGFPPSSGLGGSGYSEGEENATYRKATRPTARWMSSIINQVSATWLGMPEGLTHQFLGMESEDEAAAMTVMEAQMARGGLTVNEMRDRTGLPRFDLPEADMPMIVTGRDVVPLAGVFDRAQAQAIPATAVAPGQSPNAPGQEGEPKQTGPAPAGGSAEKPEPAKAGPGAPAKGNEAGRTAQSTAKAATADGVEAAGLAVLAADTGRVLMLQRALDPDDPAGGMWEFPGGKVEPDEDEAAAAAREWAEEVGQPVPAGQEAGGWRSGVYAGVVWVIESEDAITINAETRAVLNPDDPDGDAIEVVAWWDPGLLRGNPAVRRELAGSIDLVLAALRGAARAAETAAETAEPGKAADADGEGEAFRRYIRNIRKGTRTWRPFTFNHHPAYVAEAANTLAAQGDYAAAVAVLDITVP